MQHLQNIQLKHFKCIGVRLDLLGKVEVLNKGAWKSVCSKDFEYIEAKVICRELGFPGVFAVFSVPQTSGQEVLDKIKCLGDENNVADCQQERLIRTQCEKRKVAGAICQAG